jgi:leader peptidase (prepilin peptidase)/N-methyltransferase
MHGFWILFWFLIGACTGSFLNVVIYRMPRGESIVFPGSHCPSCGRPISWYDNIPILSWLLLRGRCRHCKARISSRYVWVELATALMVVGLYVAYFMLDVRAGSGPFETAWPMFLAHMILLTGLLACSAVDIEHWIVPLEVCWFVALVGAAGSAIAPHPWMPTVSATTGAMSLAALVGLALAIIAQQLGWIQPSFLDADDQPLGQPDKAPAQDDSHSQSKRKKKRGGQDKPPPKSVAVTAASGVNPRIEVLRELLFLAPAMVLAVGAWAAMAWFPSIGRTWRAWHDGFAGWHLAGLEASVFGYLIGGLWIWGTRILGTLSFGKEAMGLGDVHIMAAVGAVTGWIVPSLAFFLAPFIALGWAVFLLFRRNQRELPYGPWLAVAGVIVMLAYDPIVQAAAERLAPLMGRQN